MYNEICLLIQNNGWTNVVDTTGKMGPYAHSGNQWVGYDDVDMVAIKAQYILQNQLGGGMFWDLPSDDFKNLCGGGTYPLIRTLSNSLLSSSGCGGGKKHSNNKCFILFSFERSASYFSISSRDDSINSNRDYFNNIFDSNLWRWSPL